jgi:hypothetical protein
MLLGLFNILFVLSLGNVIPPVLRHIPSPRPEGVTHHHHSHLVVQLWHDGGSEHGLHRGVRGIALLELGAGHKRGGMNGHSGEISHHPWGLAVEVGRSHGLFHDLEHRLPFNFGFGTHAA